MENKLTHEISEYGTHSLLQKKKIKYEDSENNFSQNNIWKPREHLIKILSPILYIPTVLYLNLHIEVTLKNFSLYSRCCLFVVVAVPFCENFIFRSKKMPKIYAIRSSSCILHLSNEFAPCSQDRAQTKPNLKVKVKLAVIDYFLPKDIPDQ